MASCISNRARRVSGSFHRVVAAFLGGEGLPFSEILSADRIERIFCKHNCLFGAHGVYSTAVMVWAFLAQVLSDGKQASCRAAVARVVAYCHQQGLRWRRIIKNKASMRRRRIRATIVVRGPSSRRMRLKNSHVKRQRRSSTPPNRSGCGRECIMRSLSTASL